MKSLTLKCNPLIPTDINFTFTNIKLQIYRNTKLAFMPLLPTLCVRENIDWKTTFVKKAS